MRLLLQMKVHKHSIEGIGSMIMFLLLAVGFNGDWSDSRTVWWSVVILASCYLIYEIYVRRSNVINDFMIWILLFFFYSVLTYFWALDSYLVYEMAKSMLINTVILILISMNINSRQEVMNILEIILLAVLVNGVYIIWNMDLALSGTVQFGVATLGPNWNANSIGIMMAVAILISIVLRKGTDHIWKRRFYFVAILLCMFIAVFTGSRKTIFTIIAGFSLYYYIMSEKSRIKTAFQLFILITIVGLLIMNVPILYEVLGVRVAGLIAGFTGGEADSSTSLRFEYIIYGVEWFGDKIFLGHGLDNYRVLLNERIGKLTYSHNNYIEILVNLGLVGFILYYGIYFKILNSMSDMTFKTRDPLLAFLMAMILTLMAIQMGMVSYTSFLTTLIVMLSLAMIRIKKAENRMNGDQSDVR